MSLVESERFGSVLLVTVNRPDRLNALNRAVLTALDEVIRQAAVNVGVRALVLTGAGEKAFCAGADIEELQSLSFAAANDFMRFGQGVFDRLEQLPKPVIAAVNGYALGGGCELAMACDLRFAAEQAKFGQPEILLANIPGWGATQRLPRLVGVARAKDMIYSGDLIDAQTAAATGLANRVYPGSVLIPEALAYAAKLAERGPVAMELAKKAIHIGLDEGLQRGLSAEAEFVARCCSTPEQQAAVAEFLSRRSNKMKAVTKEVSK